MKISGTQLSTFLVSRNSSETCCYCHAELWNMPIYGAPSPADDDQATAMEVLLTELPFCRLDNQGVVHPNNDIVAQVIVLSCVNCGNIRFQDAQSVADWLAEAEVVK